ncbi:MAG: ferrous iron transport protein A [Alphaproteobacteria bacterium]|nr:ferrous iron transport protein A [Alphaproteobacteria bacterium]
MTHVDSKGSHLQNDIVTLADLGPGDRASINRITGDASLKRRLSAMGVVKGHEVCVDQTAPFGDPRLYTLLGHQICLRNADARNILLMVDRKPEASGS